LPFFLVEFFEFFWYPGQLVEPQLIVEQVPVKQLVNQLKSEHQQKLKPMLLLKLQQLMVMLPKLRLSIGYLLGLLLFQSLQ